jgi:hypothetical protein
LSRHKQKLLSEFATMAPELNLQFYHGYLIVFGARILHVLEYAAAPDWDYQSR